MSSTMETGYTVNPSPFAVAKKVSYYSDLRGPTVPTATAGSSAAIAFHLAVKLSLRAGDCEAAVASQLNCTVEKPCLRMENANHLMLRQTGNDFPSQIFFVNAANLQVFS
ncbi:hypothetical protein EDD18DRAFT_339137 [Armillaria luteobubalina]|uniref:Beta-ketoacyl synthase-like N-terminal domain-containing protein n=1 Tax=Armillaria luteobubalina TaxID=153913 RepID=A0AA39QPN2_9AGAR|nr:hypothetical protein EDD18DRAFT_339137 [Armillaria luteobubalina]